MTLIECFDREPVHNIFSCLRLCPEKLILLGQDPYMHDHADRIADLLAQRGLHIRVQSLELPPDDIRNIAAFLTQLLAEEDRCVIDLTGGDAQVLVAFGAVLAGLAPRLREKVSLQDFAFSPYSAEFSLSVQELISLHGGIIHPVSEQPAAQHTPAQLQPLWDAVCADPRKWNRAISILN